MNLFRDGVSSKEVRKLTELFVREATLSESRGQRRGEWVRIKTRHVYNLNDRKTLFTVYYLQLFSATGLESEQHSADNRFLDTV